MKFGWVRAASFALALVFSPMATQSVGAQEKVKIGLDLTISGYHAGWREAGHPGRGSVGLIVPVYVADSARRAREEPEASTK